jgi:hypothetical protein
MTTYKYYKFSTEQAVPTNWPNGVNVHQVGRIIDTYPTYNNLNIQTNPPTFLSGWHVNVCYEGNIDLSFVQDYEIIVANPICKWFGQP